MSRGIAYGCTLMLHARFSLALKVLTWARIAAVVLGLIASNGAAHAEGTPFIKVAPAIFAQPASQIAMPIQLEPLAIVPRNTFIRLRGLPRSVSVTEALAIGPGVWAVALLDLAKLNLNVPVEVSGRSNLLVTLVDVEGTILAEAASALVVGPAVVLAADQEPAAALSSDNTPSLYRPAGHSSPTPPLSDLSEAREERLLTVRPRPSGAEARPDHRL